MSERICPGCRCLDGEHTFGTTCTLSEDDAVEVRKLRDQLNAMHRRVQKAEALAESNKRQWQWEGYCMAKGCDIGERYLDKLRTEARLAGIAEADAKWEARLLRAGWIKDVLDWLPPFGEPLRLSGTSGEGE